MDIGSNSLLLTVVDEDGRVLHDEARVVGMGKGLGDGGRMQPDRRAAARDTLQDYVATAARLGVPAGEILAAATSGARRAADAPALFAELEAELGLRVRTIPGDEEARLSYLGALGGLSLPAGPVAVVDLGGGSTEVIIGEGGDIAWRRSLEIGAVRLTEAHLDADRAYAGQDLRPLEAHIRREVAALPDLPTGALVAVAGTATTLAAIHVGLDAWDRHRIHDLAVPLRALQVLEDRLAAASPDGRRAIAAIAPARADYLLAGSLVLRAVAGALGHDALRISDGGLRFGLLAEARV